MTMRENSGIGKLLLLMLLMSMVFVPVVSAQEEETEQVLTFGPETLKELKSNPNFIAAYGNIPAFESSDGRKKWLETLDKIYTRTNENYNKEMIKHFYPNGNVISYGYSSEGVIEVAIKKGEKIDKFKEKKLYNLFSKHGTEIKVDNVPLVFVYDDFPVPTGRSSSWRPLIGGIQIQTELSTGIAKSTLGFAAKDSSGNKGFIVAAHAAPSIGDQIWQPTAGPSANKVGKVVKVGNYLADATWVSYSNVNPTVYHSDTDVTTNVISYTDPFVGEYVYKSGIATGRTGGSVTKKMSVYNTGVGKKLDNQYLAKYRCDYGDSGSPVYDYVLGGVKILGIHWGGTGLYNSGYAASILSPVSGVKSDLRVTPLTK